MKKKNLMYGLLAAGALFAVACGGNEKKATPRDLLVANEWKVKEIVTPDSTVTEMPPRGAWIVFSDSTSRVNGNGGCNGFFGTFETTAENGLTIGRLGSTMMFCLDAMDFENLYMKSLEKVTAFNVENDELTLSNGEGLAIRFEPQQASTEK